MSFSLCLLITRHLLIAYQSDLIYYIFWRVRNWENLSVLQFTLNVVPKHRRYIYMLFESLIVLEFKEYHNLIYVNLWIQNVKAVFDSAIKVVLQPPKQKKTKRKGQKACSILWSSVLRIVVCGGWHDSSHFLVVFAILILYISYTIFDLDGGTAMSNWPR